MKDLQIPLKIVKNLPLTEKIYSIEIPFGIEKEDEQYN